MQITVCVAVTPATDTKVKIGSDGRSLDPADVSYELNPYDELAVEEALRTVEAAGEGEVQILTVGDGSQKEEVRKCLARGAHRATILKTSIENADSAAIAKALADFIAQGESQLVFLGKQAVDGDNGQVPSQLAVRLGWPVVTKISKLVIAGDGFSAEREIEGGIEKIEGSLPCVFSTEKGLNEPRYPKLKGIMQAKKKPLDEVEISLEPAKLLLDSLELPPARPAGRIIGEGLEAVDTLIDLLKNEAKVI